MHVPHASKQLHQSTVAKGDTHNQVWRAQAACTHVDQTEDEGSEGESAEAEGSRIGDTTILDLLVETRLEFTTEGRQTIAIAGGGLVSEWAIAEAGGGFGSLMLFMGHLALHAAVGLFVVVGGRVASVLGVGVSRHG